MSEPRPRKRVYLDEDVIVDQRCGHVDSDGGSDTASWTSKLIKLLTSAASGAIFGLAVEKGRG